MLVLDPLQQAKPTLREIDTQLMLMLTATQLLRLIVLCMLAFSG